MAQVANERSLPSGTREQLDPELIALPAPPLGRKNATLLLMAFVVVASIALASSLRFDLAYFFASERAVDLGEITQIDPGTLEPNTFVRVSGTPTAAATVRYQRTLTGERYVVFPLAGQRTLYVHMPEALARSGRTEFSGRLVTFGQLGGRMRDVQRYLAGPMSMAASSESFLLMVDETPSSYAWALFVVSLCLAFIVTNLILVIRWFRPLPGASEADASSIA